MSAAFLISRLLVWANRWSVSTWAILSFPLLPCELSHAPCATQEEGLWAQHTALALAEQLTGSSQYSSVPVHQLLWTPKHRCTSASFPCTAWLYFHPLPSWWCHRTWRGKEWNTAFTKVYMRGLLVASKSESLNFQWLAISLTQFLFSTTLLNGRNPSLLFETLVFFSSLISSTSP